MKQGDTQKGIPLILYKDTKVNVVAIAAPVEGMIAEETTTNVLGWYNGAAWKWAADAAAIDTAVIILPTASARNIIQPSGAAIIPLTVKGFALQSANLQEWHNSIGTVLGAVSPTGKFTILGKGTNNVFITGGNETTTTSVCVAIGFEALKAVTDGKYNVAIGYASLGNATSGEGNTAMGGYSAGEGITTGNNNLILGTGTLASITNCYDATSNVAIGYLAMFTKGGQYNVAIGAGSMENGKRAGNYNTGIGKGTLAGAFEGNFDVAIGASAGSNITTGGRNVMIGAYATGYNLTTESNRLIFDYDYRASVAIEAASAIIYGVMAATPAAQTLALNAIVSISDGLIVNELGLATCDTRIESDTEANMFFLDADGDTDGILYLGGSTNGVKIIKGGVVALIGTAKRHLSMRPTMIPGNTTTPQKPTPVDRGAGSGFSLPLYAADEEIFCNEYIAGRWDGASDIVFTVICYLDTAETDGDDFALQLSWENKSTGSGIWPDTLTDVVVETNCAAPRNAQYSIYKVDFTIDWDLPATDVAASDFFAARLRRIAVAGGGAVEIAGEVVVLGFVITYATDKIFKA